MMFGTWYLLEQQKRKTEHKKSRVYSRGQTLEFTH